MFDLVKCYVRRMSLIKLAFATDHLLAVVVPNLVSLASMIQHDANDVHGLKKALTNPKVAEKVLQSMSKTAKKAGLKG